MVSRIFKMLNKEINGLHEAAYLLGFFAFSSQLLALVRDRLLAHQFGAGSGLDIYYAAFRIPDFIFITVGSLVSASVLVPFFTDKIEKSEDGGKKFINSIFSFFSLLILITSIVAFFCIPFLVKIIFPGITGEEEIRELILLSRLLLVSPFFLGLSNFFASITQVFRRFLIYAVSPLFYNLGIIAGIVFLSPRYGIRGVVFGVMLGAALHLFMQIASVYRERIFPKFSFKVDLGEIRRVAALSFPRTLTLSSTHISLLFLTAFASLIGEGSIAVFTLAFNLQSVPLAIVGVSYSMAAFPTLSRLYSNGELKAFIEQISVAARHIIFWSIPVSVLFIVLRAQIVRTILGSGKFDWSDTRLTAAAFALFAVSVFAQSISLLFIRGYYSASKTLKPLFISLMSSALVVIFSLILMKVYRETEGLRYFFDNLLKVDGLLGTDVLMLPLSFAVGSIANAIILWIYFQRDFESIYRSLARTFFHAIGASIIMGGVAYFFLKVFDNVFDLNTLPGIFLQGLFSGVLGIAAGVIVLALLKNQELGVILETFQKRIWKTKITPPETKL